MIGKTYFPIETLSLFRVDMLCFCWGGKHHHPQGETVGCFTFFLSQQQIKQKFHHYHSQHVGPVIRTIGTFFPRKAEKRDAWQMGAPCQQRRDRPLKRRFTAVSLAVLCTVTSWRMISQPTCPQTLTYLSQKQGFIRPSYRKPPVKSTFYLCFSKTKTFSTSYLRPVGGIRQKKMSNPMTRHQIIEVWKKSRWNQRRVAWSAIESSTVGAVEGMVSLHETNQPKPSYILKKGESFCFQSVTF